MAVGVSDGVLVGVTVLVGATVIEGAAVGGGVIVGISDNTTVNGLSERSQFKTAE